MNARMQTDTWISRTVMMLGLILLSSVAAILIRTTAGQPIPEIFVTLGFVATGGLIRVFVLLLTSNLIK